MKNLIAILVILNVMPKQTSAQKVSIPEKGALEITSSALLNDDKTNDYSISVF